MDLGLKDQGAVVIGGAQGIGQAIAQAFAAEGSRVGIMDLAPSGEFEAEISVDATDYDAVCEAASQLVEKLGAVHHVVFAAGIGSGKFGFPFWNLDPSDWKRVIDVNLIGAANAAHAFAPVLTEQRAGTMLFLTSVAGQVGSQTDPPYSAAKAGVINFMQCAAKDFAKFNVRANCIAPGMVKTSLNQSVWAAGQQLLDEANRQSYDDWAAEKIGTIAPLGRWQQVEEFGAAAIFLASEKAKNITGQTINVDGGQVMHS
ncbi:MAG: SDR family oxidoreductase [Verrucomicrobiota bacterium]